ncbi:MAG: 30S ribosome-binding factor RbfA [Candidatus Rifleibacteriota bacterium]
MTRRQERVASLLMQKLSIILNRKVQDPRVQGVHLVSIDVSPDLKLARVYFSTLEESQDQVEAQKGLDSAKSFLRKELKKVIQLRAVPELAFFFDPSIRHGDKMLYLLKKIKEDS